MQTQKFKKRILVESAVFAVVIVVLLVAAYVLDDVSTQYSDDNKTELGKVNAIESEYSSLQQKYAFITQNYDLYKEIRDKQSDGRLLISRKELFEKFNQFRGQYDLNNLRLSASPIQEIKDDKYKRKTSTVSSSEVNLDLEVLFDENIYELLNAMQRELFGICVVTKLSMTMDKPIDGAILREIGSKGTYPLIKTNLKFNWYSINPVESNDATKK